MNKDTIIESQQSSTYYDNDEVKSFLEAAYCIAEAFEVSFDYLVWDGNLKVLDKKAMKRLENIENPPNHADKIFSARPATFA